MKKLLSTAAAVILTFAVFANEPEGKSYKVNKDLSSIEWVGKKVTGSHEGTIAVKEGSIMVTDGMISGGKLMIDMGTIIVTDIEDPETNGKLKGHLTSDDFFGVEKYPTSTLEITEVKKIEGEKYHIHGNLTIKGHSEKVEIPAIVKMQDGKLVAVGETEIDRTKFDIKYGSGSFFDNLGDKAIDDKFVVKFKVAAM